ncbi:MAG: hypothetical protein HFJ41_04400 [Clostridia bacterium]|nr:hypothetical protein [Clostridia bacterium]
MFISQNFSILPIRILYKITNGNILFSLTMSLVQMTIPFYISYYIIKKIDSLKEKSVNVEA